MKAHEPVIARRGEPYLISYMKGFAIEYSCNCGCAKTFTTNQLRGKQVFCFGTSIKAIKKEEV